MTDDGCLDPAAKARALISEAFGEINKLPHGTDQDATGLIEAQSHLASARRALDAWEQAQQAVQERRPRDRYRSLPEERRMRFEALLRQMDETEDDLERIIRSSE